jgi:hypothetical protein
MKKAVMLIGLLVAVVCGVFAQVSVAGQTLYYKYLYTVDSETEARNFDPESSFFISTTLKKNGDGYITFTRNSCYQSDEKGIAIFSSVVYAYQGERNNMLIFYRKVDEYREIYIYFSKDFKRLNTNDISTLAQRAASSPNALSGIRSSAQHEIEQNRKFYVYEQTIPAQPTQEQKPTAPDRMW